MYRFNGGWSSQKVQVRLPLPKSGVSRPPFPP